MRELLCWLPPTTIEPSARAMRACGPWVHRRAGSRLAGWGRGRLWLARSTARWGA